MKYRSRKYFRFVAPLLVLLLVGSSVPPLDRTTSAQEKEQAVKISDRAARQILSLAQEKESRTPAQKKIDSQLLYAIKQNAGEAITSEVESLEIDAGVDAKGNVRVDITAEVTKQLLQQIEKSGGEVIYHNENFNAIRANIPLRELEKIAESADVRNIRPADRARTNRATPPDSGDGPAPPGPGGATTPASKSGGQTPSAKAHPLAGRARRPGFAAGADRVRSQLRSYLASPAAALVGSVTSQGDTTHRAAEARAFFSVTGSGVKIGVISDGVEGLAAARASGDLPAVTVLPGQAGSGAEGTAMLEIIHDLAPGAQLFFATAKGSQARFAQNVLDLRAAGCDIIVDDAFYFREAVFQDDNVARSVNTVTADGTLFFSSAGNGGNKNDNTSGVWEGDFVDGGTLTVGATTLPGTVHDFGGGVTNNQLTAVGSEFFPVIGLFWSDPLGGSANDYDLYVLDARLTTVLDVANNTQDGNDDPVELATITPVAGQRLVVLKRSGAATRALHLNSFRGRLTSSTDGETHGHSAAAEAYSTAATPAGPATSGPPPNPVGPFPNPFDSSNKVELFSSDGLRRIFYNPNGTPITPGNFLFSTNGGTVRQKPDITAADGVSVTGSGGFSATFFGTSAAAPHAAAIAGLIKSAVPGITPAQIRTALTSSAIDIEAPGVDRDSGAGIVMAFEALQAAGAVPQPLINAAGAELVNESCPPENNAPDPGERVTYDLSLINNGGAATSNLVATLQPSANVIAPSDPQSYGDLGVGQTAGRAFSFTVAGNCGDTITLTLQLQDGANNLGTVTYSLRLGQITTNAPVTFSNPAPITIPATRTVGVAAPYPANISVAGIIGSVIKVTVTINNLSHTWPDDIDMLLVGPQGQRVMLMSDGGGGLINDLENATLIFDDAAANYIPDNEAIPSNATTTYRPSDNGTRDNLPLPAPRRPYAQVLSAFNGVDPNGTWSLYAADDAVVGVGAIAGGWSITIATETATCTTTCGQARLETTSTLSRDSGGNVVAVITATNDGSATATGVTLTNATLNAFTVTPQTAAGRGLVRFVTPPQG